MSKTTLLVLIGAAVLAVGAIAAVTPTVIVGDDDGQRLVVRAAVPAPGSPLPAPGRPGRRGQNGLGPGGGRIPSMPGMDGLRTCLEQDGPGKPRNAPDLKAMRDALKACRAELRGPKPLP